MEAQDLSPLCWLSFTASSHDHGYTQNLPATSSPPKKNFLHLFPPPVPWISARLLKGERKPLEMIVLGGLEVQLILCVSTASLYSQQSTVPLGLNPLSVSAELVLTYSSGSDGGVGVVTHTWRCFQSQTKENSESRPLKQSSHCKCHLPALMEHVQSMGVSTGQGHSSKNKAKIICWVLVEGYG